MSYPSLTTTLYQLTDLQNWQKERVRHLFGGKALGLKEAANLGIKVPATWLVSTELYELFLNQFNPNRKSFPKEEAIAFIEEHLGAELEKFPNSLFAVRSSSQYEDSAEHSFAGIFESRLNVRKEELASTVAEIWHSCHSLKLSSYSRRMDSFKMGVLIQPMIEAKYAGVCFSKHPSPATIFENQKIVIEFAPTSGEKVVQGQITPTRLCGTFDTLLETTDSAWLEDLLKALLELKRNSHHEVDIEFVIDAHEAFWLVQKRPISRTHASHFLSLSHYKRKYKRALLSLDIELLIEGCALFLAPYLEIPFQMERWMVMISSSDGQQELWVQELLNEAVIFTISQKIAQDPAYLERIHERYEHHHRTILDKDYSVFFDKNSSLTNRFFSWCEFLSPLEAHYYIPIFMADALQLLLLQEMEQIDKIHAAKDLFFMSTWGISTLMDLLNDQLKAARHSILDADQAYDELPKHLHVYFNILSNDWGFLKCHQMDQPGYTPEEIFELSKSAPTSPHHSDAEENHFKSLSRKYLTTPLREMLFTQLRLWMKIRNQEMEFLMHATLQTRPLLEEIAATLGLTLAQVWRSSKEIIIEALKKENPLLISQFSQDGLAIFRAHGKTRLTNNLRIEKAPSASSELLKGKTVFGEGKLTVRVKILFNPNNLTPLPESEYPYALVTGMTTPDFIPLLHNHFKALITDEGGILCHAAILAREIPIPTLVGTGMATEQLINDSLITIDFDHGEILPFNA